MIIVSHYLELHHDYNFILDEISRILAPNGVVIISCFNAQSFLNLFSKSQRRLHNINFINLNKLKSYLIEKKLAIIGGKFFSYCPPFRKAAKLKKYNFLNKAGDRWLPTFANSYALICKKNTTNITLARPQKAQNIKEPILGINSHCQKN